MMEKNIYILGTGVAAVSMAYHLYNIGIAPKIIGPIPSRDTSLDGVRYLHTTEGLGVSQLLSNMGCSVQATPLGGGVYVFDDPDGPHTSYSWSELVHDKKLADKITHMYADSTGRSWSPTIMNSILQRDDVPTAIVAPTYNDVVHFMLHNMQVTYIQAEIEDISLDDHKLMLSNGETHTYDVAVSTVPLWITMRLAHMPTLQIHKTGPRYVSTWHDGSHHNGISMTYYVGAYTRKLCNGLPIKRVSKISSYTIVEYFEKPKDSSHPRPYRVLPPNFTPINDDHLIALKTLEDHSIYSVGRFAELKPKEMLTDIIERSREITHAFI